MGGGILISGYYNTIFGIILLVFFGITFVPITSMCLLEGQKRFNGSFIVSTAILTCALVLVKSLVPTWQV